MAAAAVVAIVIDVVAAVVIVAVVVHWHYWQLHEFDDQSIDLAAHECSCFRRLPEHMLPRVHRPFAWDQDMIVRGRPLVCSFA